jgi:branched-chain amino acid aminotransferase
MRVDTEAYFVSKPHPLSERVQPQTVWLNGVFVEQEAALVSVLSHGLHCGTGVFEGIRAYATAEGPAVFRLHEHLERLQRSAAAIRMELPFSLEEIRAAIRELIRVNRYDACYIRPIAFRGWGELGVNPATCPVEIAVAVWPQPVSFGGDKGLATIRTTVSPWRHGEMSLPAEAKVTGRYATAALARVEAIERGFDEAILLTHAGLVIEAAIENLFTVRDGVLVTPPLSDGPLAGITRATAIELAEEDGITCREESLTLDDVLGADEIFCTSTAGEVASVSELDGCAFAAPGPVTRRIHAAFQEVVLGRDARYRHWLDPVARSEEPSLAR